MGLLETKEGRLVVGNYDAKTGMTEEGRGQSEKSF